MHTHKGNDVNGRAWPYQPTTTTIARAKVSIPSAVTNKEAGLNVRFGGESPSPGVRSGKITGKLADSIKLNWLVGDGLGDQSSTPEGGAGNDLTTFGTYDR